MRSDLTALQHDAGLGAWAAAGGLGEVLGRKEGAANAGIVSGPQAYRDTSAGDLTCVKCVCVVLYVDSECWISTLTCNLCLECSNCSMLLIAHAMYARLTGLRQALLDKRLTCAHV